MGTGGYGSKYGKVLNRICESCSTDNKETIELLHESPFFEPIVEDEFLVLNFCHCYADARARVKDETLQLMHSLSGITQIIWKCCHQRPCELLKKISQHEAPRR